MITVPGWPRNLLLSLSLVGLLGDLALHLHDDRSFGLAETLPLAALAALLGWHFLGMGTWRGAMAEMRRLLARQNRLQRDAEQAKARLEQVLTVSPATIYTLRLDTREVTFISDALQTLTGYTSEEVLACPDFWQHHLHPHDRPAALARQALLAEQGWLEHEYRFRCRDGSYRWVYDRLVVIPDGRNRPCEAVGAWLDVTAHKETSLALRDSERRFQVALQGSPVTVFTLDTGLRYTWVANSRLYNDINTLGLCHRDIFERPEEAAGIECLARQVMESGQGTRAGITFHHQGTLRFYDLTLEPLRDENEQIMGVTCAACDLTEIKNAETALKERETRFRALAENAPVGIFEADTRGRISYANGYAADLLGHPPGQLLGERWVETLHPRDRDWVVENWREATLAGQAFSGQYRFLRPDRKRIWVYGNAAPVHDLQGNVTGHIGTLVDITAMKRAQEQSNLWARAVRATHNGIVIADATRPGYPILSVNPAYERITGYRAEEVIGHSARFLHQGEEDQPGLAELRQALASGREAHVVVRNFRKDASPFWNELYIAPVRDDSGRVTHFVGVQNDITERRHYEARLLHQAHYDRLTGLPNRELLQERLTWALTQARHRGHQVAVLFTDLDRFKMINDSLGHRIGDALLQVVAARLKGCVREQDTVARLGGDEFIIVLPGLEDDPHVAARVGEKLLAALKAPIVLEGQDLFINASIGIALFPNNGTDTATLLKHADTALHKAKEAGRGTLRFHTRKMQEQALRRLSLSADLHQALDRGELTLHYQPQVSLGSGRVVGMEALLRWQHPRLGMIPPAEFIPLAEETGLILPIGEWVIRTACTHTRDWHDAGLGRPTVAVNLSTRQFIQRNLPERIAGILHDTGLAPHYLELEITESLLMRDVQAAVDTLRAFKSMGITLAVDDFGTGYSSLSYLKRFPLDHLKIDQSFVRDITTNPNDAAITRAIIDLARNLRLKVVAEGVETPAQLAVIRQWGCDEMQGWYFSRALPAELLTELLRRGQELDFSAFEDESLQPELQTG